MRLDSITTEVLVVGGGPAGSAVAIGLARAGHDVVVVEKRPEARHKSCGDALTPRAVAELALLGVDPSRLGAHRLSGVRMLHAGRALDVPWPKDARCEADGVALRRPILDERLRAVAAESGARVLMGHEATTPLAERGFVRGATVNVIERSDPGDDRSDPDTRDIHARFLVIADGANSRFGRELGTSRRRDWPYAIALRSYFESPSSAEPWIEASLGLPDSAGRPIAGQGWVIPLGDGTVNVGVAVLSTARDVKTINTPRLLGTFASSVAERWEFDADLPLKAATRLRLPLGGSVQPTMGPTFLVVGDAAGSANPLNGDGVDAALLTGRLAATVLADALANGSSTTLQRYPQMISDELDRFNKVGRLTNRFLGSPRLLGPALRIALRNERTMGAALRIANRQLRDGAASGGAERAYRLAAVISRFAPSW